MLLIAVQAWGLQSLHPSFSKAVVLHDIDEEYTGDVAYQAKRDHPDLKTASDFAGEQWRLHRGLEMPEMTKEDWVCLKLCDLAEMVQFSMEGALCGHADMLDVAVHLKERCQSMAFSQLTEPKRQQFLNWLRKNWEVFQMKVQHTPDLSW